jgi:hypothetical protein
VQARADSGALAHTSISLCKGDSVDIATHPARLDLDCTPRKLRAAAVQAPRFTAHSHDLLFTLKRILEAIRNARIASPVGDGWERLTATCMEDHELACLNRRNELNPDFALWQLTRSPLTETRRP